MMNFDSSDPDTKVVEERIPVDQWLAIHKETGLTIDPKTAEVTFYWRYVTDPYGINSDLTDEEKVVGRAYFVRAPDSDIWVSFHDLPNETRDELWRKVDAGAYPDALPGLLGGR